ncbi:MAG: hypothetical protein HYY26_02030 [Acidobacteria bacterium]|nr:hypothetical protein [Acidobacteriota bacterium]
MQALLNLLDVLFDLLFLPFRSLDPLYGLLFISVLAGIVILVVFRFTSKQKEIKRVKERLKANLLALWLFQDQLPVVFQTQGRLFRYSLAYLWYSLPSLAVMIIPVVIILVQCEMRFAQRPVRPGESFLLTARVSEPAWLERMSLQLPPELVQSAPPVRIPEKKEITWRLTAQENGDHQATVVAGERIFVKQVTVGEGLARLSPRRVGSSWLDQFLNPGELPLAADAPVELIEVQYRPRGVALASFEMHWILWFLLFSLLAAIALRGTLKTEI